MPRPLPHNFPRLDAESTDAAKNNRAPRTTVRRWTNAVSVGSRRAGVRTTGRRLKTYSGHCLRDSILSVTRMGNEVRKAQVQAGDMSPVKDTWI